MRKLECPGCWTCRASAFDRCPPGERNVFVVPVWQALCPLFALGSLLGKPPRGQWIVHEQLIFVRDFCLGTVVAQTQRSPAETAHVQCWWSWLFVQTPPLSSPSSGLCLYRQDWKQLWHLWEMGQKDEALLCHGTVTLLSCFSVTHHWAVPMG